MVGVNFAHGVQRFFGCIRAATGRQRSAFEGHAFFYFSREQVTRLQKKQLVIEIAKSLFGFQVHIEFVALFVALQGSFNDLEQVLPANQELDRVIEHVQNFTQCVFQRPGQGNNALIFDFHRRIVAV